MNSWLTSHARALARALARMRAQPLATCLSIAVIAVAILLPLALYVVFANVTNAATRLNTDPSVNVYLVLAANDGDVREIEKRLRGLENSAAVRFIPREAALAEMRRISNLADLLAGIDNNPLPHAFAIKPKSSDAEALEKMRREISGIPKIETVTCGR